MAQSKLKKFSQEVFAKKFEGVEERGIILRQKFYTLPSVTVGERVELRETDQYDTEYSWDNGTFWRKLPTGRNI